MRKRARSYLVIPLCIVFGSLAAGVFSGGRVSAATAPDDVVREGLKSFTQIFDVVQQNFADPVASDKALYKGAIPGMLHTLDPHSNFLDPKDYKALREEQRERYFGIGMLVAQRQAGGRVIVQTVFDASPAYKAGLRPGDAIVEVNDKKTDGLSTSDVADLLRGPRGTRVQVSIARDGIEKPIAFSIVRDEIARPSVSDAYFLKPGIAYIKVLQFNETTGREMEDKLKKLGERDVKGLVLDLRDNPGGLLNEGIQVASHFLKKNQLVVSLRGRDTPSKDFTARGDNGGKEYPIVAIVNRSSASAAEIVSGALQDHDRAWILGETSFGKGLVQTVYPLSDSTGLLLTTAHYYTPSGRLIQRDYSNISFLDYYYNTGNRDQKNLADVKMTDSGRTVYGGGGITPDEKWTASKLNKFQIELLRKAAFFNFSAHYFGAMQEIKLPKGWEPDENIVNQFHQFLAKNDVQFIELEFAQNHQWVKEQLKHEMYVAAFGKDASDRVSIEQDPEVMKAVESMPKAKALLDNARKQLVLRIGQRDRQP